MDDKILIKALRNYAQAYVDDQYYDFNPGFALMIANRMEQLIALSENGQSAIDTNQRLAENITELQSQLDAAVNDIKVALNTDDNCLLCKHYIKCEDESCNCYVSGYGCTDEKGHYMDWHWSCEDFNWGECPKLENTPCNGCDFVNHFEWRGNNTK